MSSVKNLAPAGAITNGKILGRLDFDNSVDDIAIVKGGANYVAFYKQDANDWRPLTSIILTETGWLNDSNPAIANFCKMIQPYCATTVVAQSVPFVTNATETGLYFDGVNKITTAPVTPQTTAEILQQALGGSGTGTGTGTDTAVKPWYTKPLNIVLAVLGLIGIGLLIKKFA